MTSLADEKRWYEETLKSILEKPCKYAEDHTEPFRIPKHLCISSARASGKKLIAKEITIKALGRQETLSISTTPSTLIGDVRERVVEWLVVHKDDQMRMLFKGKALSDDSAKIYAVLFSKGDVAEVDNNNNNTDAVPLINVIIKRHEPIPEAFWEDLKALISKHNLPSDVFNRLKQSLLS